MSISSGKHVSVVYTNRDHLWQDSVVVPSLWPWSWYVTDGQLSPLEQRTCRVCNSGQIENEEHFLIQCSKYNTDCNNLFGPININDATDEFIRIMKQSDSKILSNYTISAYELRNVTLAKK